MASLSTVYIVSLILGSLSAIGSAFVGTKIYPIQTGIDPLQGPQELKEAITEKVADVMEPTPEPLAVETVKEEPPVVEQPVDQAPQNNPFSG